ncbi:hypothetical protein [Actinotalea sp.]|uniref:hypothetical protein n=1 Tax=Actinotalea sp. TaxID=1872145 RepID=UPI00356A02CA
MVTTSSLPRGTRARGARSGLALGASVAVLGLVLAGCSGEDSTSEQTVTAAPEASAATASPSPGAGDEPGGTAVSGLIASITDSVAQVQSTGAQTAVTWTDETTVLVTSASDLSAVTVGSCVMVLASAADDTTETLASTVVVSDPVDGECVAGAGLASGPGAPGASGAAGEDGASRPTDRPSDQTSEQPTDQPTDAAGGQGAGGPGSGAAGGSAVTGQVTAVDSSTITITTTDRDGAESEASVTVGADTTYQQTVSAGTEQIAVGWCATARGTTDDRGGLTAETMTLTESVDGACAEVGTRG